MSYLSASQVTLLQTCERAYLYKYILKLPETKGEALYFGSAFDKVVDKPELIDQDHEGLDEREYPYRAILRKMVSSHARATEWLPKPMAIQVAIETPAVKGFVDAVRLDTDSGAWFIAERKTAGRIDETKREWLHNDIQVATYIAHVEHLARHLSLNPASFAGLTYEVTQKPQERMKKSETPDEFAERATSETVVWQVDKTLQAHCKKVHITTFDWARRRRDEIEDTFSRSGDPYLITGNTNQCTRYGSKCSFFDVCHGRTK